MAAVVLGVWTADRLAAGRHFGLRLGTVSHVTCETLARDGIAEGVGHLVLEGCALDLPRATVVYDGFELEAVYTPLRVAGAPTLGDIPVLVRVQDPALRAILLDFVRSDPQPEPEPWFREQVGDRFGGIDGTLLSARHRSATDRDHLARHADHLGPDPFLLAERAYLPSPWPTGISAVLFALLAVWGLFFPPSGIVAGTGRSSG